LRANLDLIARDQPVLDVAAGAGRHTIFLAAHGWRVHAVDWDATRLTALGEQARSRGLAVTTSLVDLEAGEADLGAARYGTVLVFNYLHRPLFPSLARALQPGGVLLYETFTIAQRARGHPRNPAFLLLDGELPTLVAPLDVIRHREGEIGEQFIASIAARKSLP
jgi:SAM-dependent methyltransferase